MRITVIAVGTRGDVHPLLAVAAALARSGHRVRFATESIFAAAVQQAGLEYYPLSGNFEKFHSGPAGVAFRESLDRSPAHFRRFWKSFLAPGFRKHLNEVIEPCRGADAIVCLPYLNFAPSLTELLEIPSFVAAVVPVLAFPTGEFPYPFSNKAGETGTYEQNLRSWRRGALMMRIGYEPIQAWREQVLGLPVQSWRESLAATQSLPHLFGFSPRLVPKPADWGEQPLVTGFWFHNLGAPYTPPPDLESFLANGEPPVLVGFGSHVGRDPGRLTGIVVDALHRAGKRGILVSGWGGLKEQGLPDSIYSTPGVPYDWLLPQTSAVVHHGGSGTVGICLRAGIPQIVTPFGYDQSFWGHRLHRAGVGAAPIDPVSMTAEQLAAAIQYATGNPEIRARAREMGQMVTAERGTGMAVEAIEEHMAKRSSVCAAC